MRVKNKRHTYVPIPPEMQVIGDTTNTIVKLAIEEDKELFERLRQLRLQIAKDEHLPPYIIFSDKTLHELATYKPKTVATFGTIYGVGENKKNKYGAAFIKVITEEKTVQPEKMIEEPPKNKTHMQEQKELYANAYAQWTENEDQELKRLYQEGFQIKDLSIIFQRNTGSISSRLKKLGLR